MLSPEKPGLQISAALLKGAKNCGAFRSADLIPPSCGAEELQKQCGAAAHTRHLFQIRRVGIQHLGQGSELFQKGMGNLVGVLPGHAVKQKQLQHLHLCKTVQPFRAEPLLQALPVSVMHSHCLTSFSLLLFVLFFATIKKVRILSKFSRRVSGETAHDMPRGGTSWNSQKI